ncbi:MAG: hypothetical protein ACK559_26600, partial [bacterium]
DCSESSIKFFLYRIPSLSLVVFLQRPFSGSTFFRYRASKGGYWNFRAASKNSQLNELLKTSAD